MTSTTIGIIGGTGTHPPALKDEVDVRRPYNVTLPDAMGTIPGRRNPGSYKVGTRGNMNGPDVVFLPRHLGNTPPHLVHHKDNFDTLVREKVDAVISITAVGSLKRQLEPGVFALPDDFIDMTNRSSTTIADLRHPSSLDPFDPQVTRAIENAFHVHRKEIIRGTGDMALVSIPGPRFASRAESRLYKLLGASLINMTTAPETSLARELDIPYAVLAYITDHDSCALEPEEEPTSYELIKDRFATCTETLQLVLPTAVQNIAHGMTYHSN